MKDSRDNEYQDPRALGSLPGALHIWQAVRAACQSSLPQHIAFTFSCPSESRAHRVAGFLRRRLACAATRVSQVVGAGDEAWHVHGSTQREVQSLPNLEQLSTWLRSTASSHQVELVRLTLVQAAT
jgi:hypothetical protein